MQQINAKIFVKIQKDWKFTDIINEKREHINDKTELSDQIPSDLKNKGFKFFGSTICYSFLQSVGIVNDHVVTCFRHKELS